MKSSNNTVKNLADKLAKKEKQWKIDRWGCLFCMLILPILDQCFIHDNIPLVVIIAYIGIKTTKNWNGDPVNKILLSIIAERQLSDHSTMPK